MSFLILQTFMTDMSERFLTPDLRTAMNSTTRIIRASAATNDNVNKSRSMDKELAAEKHEGGIISASLQDVEAKEIPLPPIITQMEYLKTFYPDKKKCCTILVSLHGCDTVSGKAIQAAVKELGTGLKRKNLPIKRVVADTAGGGGLPMRAAADLLNCLDGAELDVAQFKPQMIEDAELEDSPAEIEKKMLANVLDQLAVLSYGNNAGDWESAENSSIIIADSETIKLLYKLVYRVEYAKAFEEAERADFLCTAWRFDFLTAAEVPKPKAASDAGRNSNEPVSSSMSPRSEALNTGNSACRLGLQGLRAQGSNLNVVGAQMRRLQF